MEARHQPKIVNCFSFLNDRELFAIGGFYIKILVRLLLKQKRMGLRPRESHS